MRIPLAVAALLIVSSCGFSGSSGPINSACMEAGRSGANPTTCSCIQQMANQTLSRPEQRRAAKFFAKPDLAQQTRTSASAGDKQFWTRYRAFSNTAETYCRRSV